MNTKCIKVTVASIVNVTLLCFQVKVTQQPSPGAVEITLREQSRGDFFGEKALLG